MPHQCTTCGHVFADGSKEMLSGCPDCGGNKFQFKPVAATEQQDAPAGGRDPETDPTGTGGDDTSDAGGRKDLSADSTAWPDHGYGSGSESGTDDRPDASADTSTADTSAADADASAADRGTGADTTGSTEPGSRPTADDAAEDPAQADARTDVVSPDEIAAATPEETEGTADPDAPGSPATRPNGPGTRATDAGGSGDDAAGRPGPRPDDRPDLEDLREELNEQFESIRIVAPGEYELNLMELYDRTEYIISLQEDGRYVIEVPDTWDTTPDPDGS